MRSMVSRTRSRITRSMVSAATSRPSPGSRFLLSLPTASSSGTRCPAGAVVGQLRRMMTPSFHFSTTRPTLPRYTLPEVLAVLLRKRYALADQPFGAPVELLTKTGEVRRGGPELRPPAVNLTNEVRALASHHQRLPA